MAYKIELARDIDPDFPSDAWVITFKGALPAYTELGQGALSGPIVLDPLVETGGFATFDEALSALEAYLTGAC